MIELSVRWTSWLKQGGRGLFLGSVVLCLVAIGYLATEVVKDLQLLNSANSDNVQWTLSQAEVEFLELRHAISEARSEPDDDLEKVVEEFDVFYSRVDTLAYGDLYAELREIPSFSEPLGRTRTMLENLVPLIDGPRAQLEAELDEVDALLETARPDLRALATAGLFQFARQSDTQRDSVAVTLSRLALLTGVLVLVLAVLLRHARRVSRQTKRRGRELEAAYARLNTIFDASLDAVIVADEEGRIQRFNPAAERIFRYDVEEVIGLRIGEVIVPEHLRAAHDAGMTRMQETGEHRVVGHGRVRMDGKRSTGEVFPVELAVEQAQTGDEKIVIGFLRDISQRVRAENELVEARDKALAGEKAKAEFLAMMTHEIRTPLNGVLGNLSLLRETRLTPEQSRFVHNMAVSGKLLMSHVDAVLDIARFEAGTAGTQMEVVHIGDLVQDVIDSQTSPAEAAGNVLGWGWIGEPVTWVAVDASRLQQVLLNLLGNAVKFTRYGRISIELERLETPAGASPMVEFRIIDTGVGIPEQDLDRVFEDFQTGTSNPAESGQGTGLGLGIARRFVTAIGGEIGAESALGEGSVFWLRIPVELAEAPHDARAPDRGSAQFVARDILLVEDNEINLQLAQDMLRLIGHRVSVARNGQEAVDAAAEQRFDLILMDIRMPVMDGLAATRAIREGQGPCRDVPIVALSANVLPEAKDRFIAGGMSDFLGKPLDKQELAQVIARFCTDKPGVASATDRVTAPADPIAALKARYVAEATELFDWLATGPDDWNEIAERSHRTAGSAAAFGQPELRLALLKVETAAEAENATALTEAVQVALTAWKNAPEPRVD
ncbi:PAS domain-containing hybrid sensor histidine kinase/response regulator [Mameliella sp. MMSF_3455]|uniref:hybrid sensor histidine kinase/response regulator n=1 Tax=Mameliella sp. MMSF_3455 TaxID=3046714 RepID=UPI00273D349D|nr:PAS domain-containing hybrid sensor histidine kinase/response regulator [Mameliella sp. MMSF_3455]